MPLLLGTLFFFLFSMLSFLLNVQLNWLNREDRSNWVIPSNTLQLPTGVCIKGCWGIKISSHMPATSSWIWKEHLQKLLVYFTGCVCIDQWVFVAVNWKWKGLYSYNQRWMPNSLWSFLKICLRTFCSAVWLSWSCFGQPNLALEVD